MALVSVMVILIRFYLKNGQAKGMVMVVVMVMMLKVMIIVMM